MAPSAAPTSLKKIIYKKDGAIAYLVIDRREVLNALNGATLEELRMVFTDIAANPDVRVVISTGTGDKAFVAGADIGELVELNVVKPDAIFASNTSSISITKLMSATKRPERFVGLHFFNPVAMMALVEVARTIATAPDVYETAFEFTKAVGKVPVCTSDKIGFIVNRLLIPYLLDAIRAYEEGVGTIADIDLGMRLGCGYPMGPFTLANFIGLDTTHYITQVMFDEFKERRFASPALLKRMVMAGWMGKKSAKGFYDYRNPEQPVPQDAALQGFIS